MVSEVIPISGSPSFLSDRSQCVLINATCSPPLPVISGVPQGTVLGPLLFLLYINDITDNVSSEIRLFADDCILYRPIISLADRAILQKDINTLYNWSQTWQMCFNAKKCHILNISRKRQKPCLHYQLRQEALSVVDSYPYLGVTISSDLHWHEHINNISAKATRTLNFCSP